MGGLAAVACEDGPFEPESAAAPKGGVEPTAAEPAEDAAEPEGPAPASLVGSAIARTADGKALVVADEDHDAVRWLPLPLDVRTPPVSLELEGQPAQVVALGDRVLVTLRDPGALVVLRPNAGGELVEESRVALPADAWGLAVTDDQRTAIVTSAWTHRVSAVDLDDLSVRWTVSVGREPRGVTITSAGVAYVSHLVGTRVTRIDDVAGREPHALAVELPAAPLRARRGEKLDASLAYAPVLSPDDSRLYVPRTAIGAQGSGWWFGASTVDVLSTDGDRPVSPGRAVRSLLSEEDSWSFVLSTSMTDVDGPVPLDNGFFTQPRAMVFRKSTGTLLVAGEGSNALAELDARASDPALSPLRVYGTAVYESVTVGDMSVRLPRSGGAPTGIVLSEDESTAYVFCRTTNDVAQVHLDSLKSDEGYVTEPPGYVTVADEPLPLEAAQGRRMYFDATDFNVSGGYGCAGCHPDGRDDGHVWHEISASTAWNFAGLRGSGVETIGGAEDDPGVPRQTPMLAGRVGEAGVYGWRGESVGLEERLDAGFGVHRWAGSLFERDHVSGAAKAVASYVRRGLVPPPVQERPLTAVELRGKEVFERADTACATCHAPETRFTDRGLAHFDRPTVNGFADEPDAAFKTPSLLYVGSTPPYYHDGATGSLDALVRHNGSVMGHTEQLSKDERTELTAYLFTIGGPSDPPASLPLAHPVGKLGPAVPENAEARKAVLGGLDPKPKRADWKDAPELKTRARELVGCRVKRLGSWAQLSCDPGVANGFAVVGGDPTGFDVWRDVPATMVLPLRKGEHAIVQIASFSSEGEWGGGVSTSEVGFLEVRWLDGEAEPTILML